MAAFQVLADIIETAEHVAEAPSNEPALAGGARAGLNQDR
jgi:hypothetical protein